MFPLNESCVISRPVKTLDALGGYNQTLTVIGTFDCRFSGLSASERYYAGKSQINAVASLYLNAGTDIQVEDVVTCRGSQFISTAPMSPSIQAYTKVMLKDVKR